MFPRTEKLVFNFGVPIQFFLLSESINVKFLAVPACNTSVHHTLEKETALHYNMD